MLTKRHWRGGTRSPPPRAPAHHEPLLTAISNDSVEEVERALEADPLAAVRPISARGEPPLLAAVRYGCHPRVLHALALGGADTNATDGAQVPPLAILAGVKASSPDHLDSDEDGMASFDRPVVSFDLFGGGNWFNQTIAASAIFSQPQQGQKPMVSDPHSTTPRTSGFTAASSSAPAAFAAAAQPSSRPASLPLQATCTSMLTPLTYNDVDEERRLQSAAVLLAFGARKLWKDGAGRTLAQCGEANGQHRLAMFLEHWGGAQVQSLDRLRGGRGSLRASGGGPCLCLLSLPDVVLERICEMLAPNLLSWQAYKGGQAAPNVCARS